MVKITGSVDVSKVLDDVNQALEKVRGLGVQGSEGLPEKLTEEQKKQAADAIKNLAVEIYTGKEDSTLRRIVIDMAIEAPAGSSGGAESGTLKLDFSLLDLNEDAGDQRALQPQAVRRAALQPGRARARRRSARPAAASRLGSGSGSDAGGGASADALKKYSECVEKAGSDVDEGPQVRGPALTVAS